MLVLVVLCCIWWKLGLSPRQRNPARDKRFRWGHTVLAISNAAMLFLMAIPWLAATPMFRAMPRLACVFMLPVTLVPFALFVGLGLVWTSAGRLPAADEDTQPAAEIQQRATPSAQWPANAKPSKPKGKPPSVLMVLSGLVGSGFLLFMAAVFGDVAFSSDQKLLMSRVLPIYIGVCAVYLLTTLALL